MNEMQELITIEEIQSKVYIIRGQQVMLDGDLAEIYGYETRKLNEQVRNNKERFPEDFMFQLRKEEIPENFLKSKNRTLNEKGNKRGMHIKKMPYAFTEQGVYMLATVLRGSLADQHSIIIMRAFKSMRHYIQQNQQLVSTTEFRALTQHVSLLTEKTNQLEDGQAQTNARLDVIAQNFITDTNLKQWTFVNGEKFEADIAYITIFQKAKRTIHIIDNYIGPKTLDHLSHKKEDVDVVIFTRNNMGYGGEHLTTTLVQDFNEKYPNLSVKPNTLAHDRYIVIDYDTDDEIIYHSGPSVKDAGSKLCSLLEIKDTEKVHEYINTMLQQDDLTL